jgi:hypothetical protein
MKKYILLLPLWACGQVQDGYISATKPSLPVYCSVKQDQDGALVTCPDGTTSQIYNGINGTSITGATGQTGAQGAIGATGLQGTAGTNGTNGHSLAFEFAPAPQCGTGGYTILEDLDLNDNGLVDDGNISSATICNGAVGTAGQNGTNGANGSNGTNGTNASITPFTPVSLLAPCADDPMHPTADELADPRLEVFLKLENGTILNSFSDNVSGYNTHFGVLSPGTYESTGATNCVFKLEPNGDIKR